jgi:hypothetical protein
MQLAKPGADVALDSAVTQDMPVASHFALNRLIHVATDLCLRSQPLVGDRANTREGVIG